MRFTPLMITKASVEREARRQSLGRRLRLGEEIRRRRLETNVSLRALAAVVGVHPSHLARMERGEVEASIAVLTRLSIALGCELGVHLYAGAGPRLHDRFQAPMVEGLLAELHARWRPTPELVVPPPIRGVVDLSLADRYSPLLVLGEFQSEMRRLEQQIRWHNEKAAAFATDAEGGARPIGRLLILRSTTANRAIARTYQGTLAAAYPGRTVEVWRAVTEGADWPGDGVLWMRSVEGRHLLMSGPPRDVRLGR
jgi:transcriptional regulator with XRE-family HTH domain